ncbi:hypothetical protein RFI_29038 [Reticulomyxa filosa]|uniref:Glycosyltransferase family 92 protein n=1 Tax=Reticulomyxa filosa TaxID=46433 RepID=X6M2F4_RETFI|nr:hypothetical protein RFI_29038 [Reticulomyxa filosa]|eukprot:ETO08348.1 hypothetical protein RFI_29038 [Reticulomyxa filosa]
MLREFFAHYGLNQDTTFPNWNITFLFYVALLDEDDKTLAYLRSLQNLVADIVAKSNRTHGNNPTIQMQVYGWRAYESNRGIWYFSKELLYNDCLNRHMQDFQYLMFMDVDDFVVLHDHTKQFDTFHQYMLTYSLQFILFKWEQWNYCCFFYNSSMISLLPRVVHKPKWLGMPTRVMLTDLHYPYKLVNHEIFRNQNSLDLFHADVLGKCEHRRCFVGQLGFFWEDVPQQCKDTFLKSSSFSRDYEFKW